MKRMCTLCFLLLVTSTLGLAQATSYPLLTATPDVKLERELLTAKILAQKAQGVTPDPALYEQLRALTQHPTRSGGRLDQGNDTCPATVISTVPYTDFGSTTGRANNFNCAGNTAPDVIYQITPSVSGLHVISTCSGAGYDTRLELRYDGACPGSHQLTCNDDYCGLQSQIAFNMTAGTPYYIIVDGYSTDHGNYTLTVSGPPQVNGETCLTAYPLTVPGSISGNSCSYTHDYDWACIWNSTSDDVVYTYTPTGNQQVTFSLCQGTTNYDTKLYIYAGSCSGTPVACNDDACTAPNYPQSYVSRLECVQLTGGTPYYIVVDGYGGACGNYTLTAEACGACAPPGNDDCANVTPQSLPINTTGNNECSTHDCSLLNAGEGEVWHAFTLENAADVQVRVCGLEGNWGVFYMTLMAGCPCADDVWPATNEWDNSCAHGGSVFTYANLSAGTYYYPVIYHEYNNSVGNYSISIISTSPPPCETDLALAAPGTLQGNTVGAGDDCALNIGPEQIVAVTIPYAGEWTFTLCTGYTGYDAWLDLRSECCGGELVASTDDDCGIVPRLECVALGAGTYYLHVEGYSSSVGAWGLEVASCTPPPCSPTSAVEFFGTAVPQSLCAALCPEAATALVLHPVGGEPALNPNRPPVVTLRPGCNSADTDCDNNACTPSVEFSYDPLGWVWENGSWHNSISGAIGCVCVSLDGFLNVELSAFDAIPGSGEVTVEWSTASETGNDHFEILRDGSLLAITPSQGNGAQAHAYRWVDRGVANGTTYRYTLYSVDFQGVREELGAENVVPALGRALVTEYALHQNHPNPFNPQTEIRFDLPEAALVELTIYNALGQHVATLIQGKRSAGSHTVAWDGTDDAGYSVPTGLYIYQIRAGSYTHARKMLLMK